MFDNPKTKVKETILAFRESFFNVNSFILKPNTTFIERSSIVIDPYRRLQEYKEVLTQNDFGIADVNDLLELGFVANIGVRFNKLVLMYIPSIYLFLIDKDTRVYVRSRAMFSFIRDLKEEEKIDNNLALPILCRAMKVEEKSSTDNQE